MITVSFLTLISAIIGTIAIILVLNILGKVYQEDYKKPWVYIGISTLFLAISQILQFLTSSFEINIQSQETTIAIIYMLNFISITILTYAILLEFLILKYYKGKFVKMKFIPVQEKTQNEELDLNIISGTSYFTYKKIKIFTRTICKSNKTRLRRIPNN